MNAKFLIVLPAALTLGLLLAACGDKKDATPAPAATAAPAAAPAADATAAAAPAAAPAMAAAPAAPAATNSMAAAPKPADAAPAAAAKPADAAPAMAAAPAAAPAPAAAAPAMAAATATAAVPDFGHADADLDGKISLAEAQKIWPKLTQDQFNSFDLDKSGFLSGDEYAALVKTPPAM
jgi:hypothetical protein